MQLVKIIIVILLFSYQVLAQSLGYNLSRTYGAYASEYLKPFSSAFTTAFNSGTFHSANPGNEKLSFYASVKFMGAFIPDNDRKFSGTFTETVMYKFNNVNYPLKAKITVNDAPTVFGSSSPGSARVEIGDTIRVAGVTYPITESWTEETVGGIVSSGLVPFFVPQIGAGPVYGTDIFLRWLPSISLGQYGSISFFGAGIRHHISRYFGQFPIDISIQFAYQGLFLSDSTSRQFLSLESLLSGIQISREFSGLTVYSALQFENTALDLDYTFQPSSQGSQNVENYRITYNPGTETTFRFLAGASFKFGNFVLSADLSFTSYTGLSAGCGYIF